MRRTPASQPSPLDPAGRRQLLRLAAATAASAWLPRAAFAQRGLSFDPFALGVASGSPSPDGMVLWTRLVAPGLWSGLGPAPVPVRWEVAHDEAFGRIALRGETVASSELAHSVHVEVQGLEPDRWYFYRFVAGGVASPVGRTRTLPAPDAMVSRLRVAYASCQRWDHGHYAAYRHMRADQPDLVLFLGDYIYEYPNATAAVRNFPTLGLVTTLAEYRDRHALHRSDPQLQAMHAACPWLVVWDDHEVQNDYAGIHPGDSRPVGLNGASDFGARRAAAHQAYYEHMPLRAAALARAFADPQGPETRLHGRWRFGRLADIVLMDTRQWRDVQACGRPTRPAGVVDPAACPALEDPSRSLLGAAQERWLEGALAQARGGWTVLAQQTLFGRRDNKPGPGEALWNDGWDGYGAARRRVTDAIQRHRPSNPVFLGGDVHENWVGHVKADYGRPDSADVAVEFCGTSISSRSSGVAYTAQRLAENPHFIYGNAEKRGYGLCDFTPGGLVTTLRGVVDVSRPDSDIETLAKFAVQPGRAKVERA